MVGTLARYAGETYPILVGHWRAMLQAWTGHAEG